MNNGTTMEYNAAVQNGIKRMALTVLSMLVEIIILLAVLIHLSDYAQWFLELERLAGLLLVLFIYGKHETAAMKMPWIMLILVFPIGGVMLYLLIGLNGSTHKMKKRYELVDEKLLPLLPKNDDVLAEEAKKDKRLANISHYLRDHAGYPVYNDTAVTYYDDGAKGLEAQKEELKKAQKFIFMEYHAIEDAESWHGLEEILVERVNAGVEVRLFYDDMGSIGFINTDFVERMQERGINCRVFNPFAPGMNIFLNNRDHRKITVIDGQVGFTGGYNLANEYFHVTEPYGFWKDTGIKLVGSAVQSLTVTFLEMWNAVSDDNTLDRDVKQYLPEAGTKTENAGFVQPYADSPMDNIAVGEDVYISVAEAATEYAWFITPYLIITDEMNHALTMAAKRGVDVRIITPGIPDKKIVYSLTRSYYNGLVRDGVRIFEFTPGFCHCKMSVADDLLATCGTINMDYRSLYHHFENGCVYADCKAVMDTKRDFEETMAKSEEVTEYYRSGRGAFRRFGQMLLRLVAPLM